MNNTTAVAQSILKFVIEGSWRKRSEGGQGNNEWLGLLSEYCCNLGPRWRLRNSIRCKTSEQESPGRPFYIAFATTHSLIYED